MYCVNCGAAIEEGERFCSICGTRVEAELPGGQQTQPSGMSVPPAYPQMGGYPPAPSAYPQMGGQPPYGGQGGKPPRKKPGKGLWIGIVAGALALILVLVLFVYPGVLVGRRGPLSGNTVQTRFFNDTAAVYTDAFSGLADTAAVRMMQEPFELSADIDVDTDYGKTSSSIEMAYDGTAFGFEADSGSGEPNILLLLEDTIYITSYGGVQGIEFDTTEADLSQSMALSERIQALTGATGGKDSVDWLKLTEMLVNSINKDCIKKGSSETTLMMESGDITDMLNTFWDKLKEDDALLKSLEDYLEDTTGESVDIEDMIDEAVAMVKAADATIEWVVSYDKGKPVFDEITIEANGQEVTTSFGYEKQGKATEITYDIKSGSSKMKYSFTYERTKEGLQFSGTINMDGQKVSIEGTMAQTKDEISGTIEIDSSGYTTTIEYDGTLTFGKPDKDVEDMFDIDTGDAHVQKLSEVFGMLGYAYSGLGINYDYAYPDVSPAESVWPEAPAETSQSLDGTLWVSEGYQDGSMYVSGTAMYFYNGMVYFGDETYTASDCLNYNMSPYEVSYTFDGYIVTLSSQSFTETQDFYMIDNYTMMGSDGTYFYRQ